MDAFSASEKVKTAFMKKGRRAESFDIQWGHDITTRIGFFVLVDMGMRPLATTYTYLHIPTPYASLRRFMLRILGCVFRMSQLGRYSLSGHGMIQ